MNAQLRPLPMRVTEMQLRKLRAQRDFDGLSIQEHVRRALDFYFAMTEDKPSQNPDAEPVSRNVDTEHRKPMVKRR